MSDPFDFDFWVQAYKDDPDNFNELQKAHIHAYIDDMDISDDKKSKLKGLFWKVSNDPRIVGTSNGLVRAARAHTLMAEKLNELNDLWQRGITDDK